MTERPILFNGAMVRAILAGRKTQTRRVMKPQPSFFESFEDRECTKSVGFSVWYPREDSKKALHYVNDSHFRREVAVDFCPFGQPGDRLWVRESFNHITDHRYSDNDPGVFRGDERGVYSEYSTNGLFKTFYAADPEPKQMEWEGGWKPSIHMPRWASRITLEVTGVRVERLQQTTEADAKAEGFHALYQFQNIWEELYGDQSWPSNPWVWVIEFNRVTP